MLNLVWSVIVVGAGLARRPDRTRQSRLVESPGLLAGIDPPVDAAGCLDVGERLLRSTRRAATPRCCAAELADTKRA
jgi:hypothetical protein